MSEIPEDRPLSAQELELTRWLLAHGQNRASRFLDHLPQARVAARCSCGCASIDFSIDGRRTGPGTGMDILADYKWHGSGGELFGVFVFAQGDLLGGLEVWSIDGQTTPTSLPDPAELSPLGISTV